MEYLRFLRTNRRFLGYGFLLTFLASFGQTFYISVFGGEIRAAFDLSHGDFGLAYGIGTLSGGVMLIFAGRVVDHFDLRPHTAIIAAGLAVGCLILSYAQGFVILAGAFFLLRLFGQGLMSHTATTAMGRYFDIGVRGRAVSIAVLGFPVGEAVFPSLAVFLIAAIGWRETWLAGSIALIVVFIPALLILLRGHGERHRALTERLAAPGASKGTGRQWSRGEVLRDWRFAAAMVAMMGPAFITTGLFFHQVHLVESKGWTLGWFATGFVMFALLKVCASLLSGSFVDRFGARWLALAYLAPLGFGLSVLGAFDARVSALVFMALAGVNGGMGQTLMGTLWAEIYGVRHLGAVRGLVFGLIVIASATAPPIMGALYDFGTTVEAIAFCSAGYCLFGSILLAWLFRSGAWISGRSA
jgi:MFS family permease